MKTLIDDYSFNASTKKITLNELTSIKIEQILLITNITDNTIIYNFADSNLGGSVVGNVLTLKYDTALMDNLDSLQIFIETPNTDFVQLNNLLTDGIAEIVHQLQSLRNDGGMADVLGRVRCAVETLPTLGTCTNVTTVATATNVANMGGFAMQLPYVAISNQSWGNLRNKITVS